MSLPRVPKKITKSVPKRLSDRGTNIAVQHKWQDQKSDLARKTILKAAAKCLSVDGYSKLTIAAVAKRAGLSIGATQHHFRSKSILLEKTIRYIFRETLHQVIASARKPEEPITLALHKRRIESEWEFMQTSSFTASAELAMASRTDPALLKLLDKEYKRYVRQKWEQAKKALPEWGTDMEKFEFTADLVATVLEGMRLRQLFGHSSEARDRKIRTFLIEVVNGLYENELQVPADVPKKKPQ